ncbi:AMP-binding enzyme [Zalerion maritima]|uniref:AMP-binding enzyme n=1 Tax=Zalerion maritima TaxID=339359 RepID=A0AAD5RPE9_9PEZI|nr:AMP-binding enzyme [Zalerion maritima]
MEHQVPSSPADGQSSTSSFSTLLPFSLPCIYSSPQSNTNAGSGPIPPHLVAATQLEISPARPPPYSDIPPINAPFTPSTLYPRTPVIFEQPSGNISMPISSRWTAEVPNCSLQKWIFGSDSGLLPPRKTFVDADDPSRFLTHSDYRLFAKRFAVGLQRAGLQSGDRVLLFSGNNIFFPSVFIGVIMAGGVFTGANPSFVARELAHQLKDSGAKFMLTAEKSLQTALEAAELVGLPKNRVLVFTDEAFERELAESRKKKYGEGVRHWTDLIADKNDGISFSWVEPSDSGTTTCCLNYSSGTTGVPKGVEISHRSYVANGVGVVHLASMQNDWEEYLQKRARGLCFLPMYHAYAQTYFVANFAKMGIPTYVMKAFDFEAMLKHVQEYKITVLTCVPPIVVALAKHPLAKRYDLSSVETLGSGAAPLGREVAQEVERLWNTVHHTGGRSKKKDGQPLAVRQGWGMTEVTCSCMAWDPSHPVGTTAAVGELLPNCSGKLVDTSSDDPTTFKDITEPNKPGELWVTGPTLMRGYWRNEKATKESILVDNDGTRWFRTGDVAYVEGEYGPGALFHIVDRIKELIKVKGNQVAPAELEALLLERPDVIDVAVVGVTIGGEEVPRAYVVPAKQPESGDEKERVAKEISEWMAAKTARFKWLRGGVDFIDAIPKNPSGKILRRHLREKANKEVDGKFAAKL